MEDVVHVDMVHRRYGTCVIWYMGDGYMGDMIRGRYGSWKICNMGHICTWEILYMGETKHGRYGTGRYCTWEI